MVQKMDIANNMRRAFLTALMAACLSVAVAADEGKSQTIGIVNLNDSAAVYKALYNNTPIEPVFKLVPQFAIVGLDNKFVFSVGASFKFTSSLDWSNPVQNPGGLSVGALQPSTMKNQHLFQMTAGGSGVYFNIIGFPNTANETGLFISLALDHDGNNTYKVGAGQVYMRYKNFQIGWTSSLYNDRESNSYTIDGSRPCASGAFSTVGMNWQHFFNRHIRVGAGVELPNNNFTQILPMTLPSSLYSDESNNHIPNFPFYVSYVWGKNHVRLSGLIKDIQYVDLTNGHLNDQIGFGAKLTGHVTTGALEWFWMGQYGYASASTFSGDRGLHLDLVPDENNLGKLKPTQTWGLIAATQWNITPRKILTVQYSHMRNIIPYYSVNAETPYEDQMRSGNTFTINGVYKLSSLFSTGIEYRFVDKRNVGGYYISNNRIYTMLMMNF